MEISSIIYDSIKYYFGISFVILMMANIIYDDFDVIHLILKRFICLCRKLNETNSRRLLKKLADKVWASKIRSTKNKKLTYFLLRFQQLYQYNSNEDITSSNKKKAKRKVKWEEKKKNTKDKSTFVFDRIKRGWIDSMCSIIKKFS